MPKAQLALLLMALLALPNLPSAQDPGPQRAILMVSDTPLASLAKQRGLSLSEAEELYGEELRRQALRLYEGLREEGLALSLVEVLITLIHALVLELPWEALEELVRRGYEIYPDTFLTVQLERSVPWIGADLVHRSRVAGVPATGRGVTVAVIDTGIDYTHPDLGGGLGPGKKVVGGWDFVDEDPDPKDENGHGTQVAGIIAAKGSLVGVAPDARLLAYRVVDNFGFVASSDLVRALERAVRSGAQVINLSLGAAQGGAVDEAITNAIESGIVVVAAVGNLGPSRGTIASPASSPGVLAVAATLNNVSSSLSADLDLGIPGFIPTVYPMRGSPAAPQGVSGKIVFVGYAREVDVKGLDLEGAIALAERGGGFGEVVFFSEKEENVASKGAVGLIIFNNRPGIFLGSLVHELNPEGYEPTIPVVSMSREDGLRLRRLLEKGELNATLRVSRSPDAVALFSSRGPSSPFYLKPDLAAPGASINTTSLGGSYMVVSGTSFASPHVAGAAAIILQKYPTLSPAKVGALLKATAKPLLDSKGRPLSIEEQGAGRLNLSAAFKAQLIPEPPQVILHLSRAAPEGEARVKLSPLVQGPLNLSSFRVRLLERGKGVRVELEPLTLRAGEELTIRARLEGLLEGDYEARIFLEGEGHPTLSIPLLVHVTRAHLEVDYDEEEGVLRIRPITNRPILGGQIRIMAPNGKAFTLSIEPKEGELTFRPRVVGEYWIEGEFDTGGRMELARATVYIPLVVAKGEMEAPSPLKPQAYGMAASLMMGIFLLSLAAALAWRRRVKGSLEGAI